PFSCKFWRVGSNLPGRRRAELHRRGRRTAPPAPAAPWPAPPVDGKEATLDDLKQELEKVKRGQAKGVALSLKFSPGEAGVARIDAAAPTFFQWPRLIRTDAAKSTITVALDGQEVTLPMRYDAKVTLYSKEAALKDLRAGMSVELRLAVDG